MLVTFCYYNAAEIFLLEPKWRGGGSLDLFYVPTV